MILPKMSEHEFNKPILVLDFDGVLHSYTSGWKGFDVIPDPPVEGAAAFVTEAIKHFHVSVYSARSSRLEGRLAMIKWMRENGFPSHDLSYPAVKPPAFLTIDDRCVCFSGRFPAPRELLAFKPWYNR